MSLYEVTYTPGNDTGMLEIDRFKFIPGIGMLFSAPMYESLVENSTYQGLLGQGVLTAKEVSQPTKKKGDS